MGSDLPGHTHSDLNTYVRTQAAYSPGQRRQAARFVASMAADIGDCAQLLAMLGLKPEEGLRD